MLETNAPSRTLGPFLSLVATAMLTGCGMFGATRVRTVATSVEPPANIGLYVEVTDAGEPVEELTTQNFAVYENGERVPDEQAQLTLLPREHVALHHVLLLVDMSDPKTNGALMARAVADFTQKVRSTQAVTVYAFDGTATPMLVGQFQEDPHGAPVDLPRLATFRSRDSSRDLGSALQAGVKELGARLMQSKKPVRVGALVVFTRGADLAARVPEERWTELLSQTEYDVFALVPESEKNLGYRISDAQVILDEAPGTPGIVFERAAQAVRDAYFKYYLVAYCSPSRAGQRRLTLEVSYTTPDGDRRRADTDVDFSAAGFGPGCDAASPPGFTTSATGSLGKAPTPRRPPGDLPQSSSPADAAPDPGATPDEAAESSPGEPVQ